MAHCFKAHSEVLAEQVDVIAQGFRLGQEAAIGQQQGARKVAGKADAGQRAGFVAAKAFMGCERFDQIGRIESRDLCGELKCPLA
ncbi:hypothetical protein D3C87_1518540 [compost metagenome]